MAKTTPPTARVTTEEPLSAPPRVHVAGRRHLLTEDVERIHGAAVRAGLAHQRAALLGGIDPDFVANLLTMDRPSAQLRLDIYSVDTTLDDGSVPLFAWLRNACAISAGRPEAAVFETLVRRLEASPAPEIGPPLLEALALFSEEVRGSVRITIANLADKEAVARAREMGDGGSLDVVTAPPATFVALGVREGASIRVIDVQTWRWRKARIALSTRFHLVGISRALREHFGLVLDPKSTPGRAPLRGLTLALSPFAYDVALSFEEADRARALGLARALESRGVSVYTGPALVAGGAAWCAALISTARAWQPAQPLPGIARGVFARGDDHVWPVIIEGPSVDAMPGAVRYADDEQVASVLFGRLQQRGP